MQKVGWLIILPTNVLMDKHRQTLSQRLDHEFLIVIYACVYVCMYAFYVNKFILFLEVYFQKKLRTKVLIIWKGAIPQIMRENKLLISTKIKNCVCVCIRICTCVYTAKLSTSIYFEFFAL